MVRRTITAPIEELTAAADRFAANEKGVYTHDDVADLDIHTGDEIEEPYNATRFMQTSLIDYMDNLTRVTAEKERIGAELNVATRIQASMLPTDFDKYDDLKRFTLFASMDPAKEVGGDFYDFFMIDDDHLAMVIADVSGKGVPAALFMMSSKILINDHAIIGGTPAEIL
jgi:sigma-B regulation protein RsbU (phosphoserine phosphatase)